MKYNNTVIKVLNEEHGAKVIQFYKDQGVDSSNYLGCNVSYYYGLINNRFAYYTLEEVKCANATIIELPNELPQRGDMILVWDVYEEDAIPRIFLTYIEGEIYPIRVVLFNDEDYFKNNKPFNSAKYKHWKPIPKEELVELTVEDIFDIIKKDLSIYYQFNPSPKELTINDAYGLRHYELGEVFGLVCFGSNPVKFAEINEDDGNWFCFSNNDKTYSDTRHIKAKINLYKRMQKYLIKNKKSWA